MECNHCGTTIPLRKSLRKASDQADRECPECGEDPTASPTRLSK